MSSADVKVSLIPKNSTNIILVALSLTAVGILLWRISEVFAVGFGGVVLGAALRALADPLARVTRLAQHWNMLIVIAGLTLLGVLMVFLFGQQVSTEIAGLQQQLPQAWGKFINWLNQSELGRLIVNSGRSAAGDSKLFANLGIAAGAAIGAVTTIVLVVFLAIYFAADPMLYRNGFLRLLPPPIRPRVGRALDDAGEALRKWLVAQAIAMVTVGLLAGTTLAVVGVPLAFALGIVAGLMEFIPVLGPILSALPGVLLAFAKGPRMAVYAIIVYTVVQLLESNVIVPLLQRWTIRLPPVVGLLAIVACGFLFGAMGIIFATPIAVVVTALVKHLYIEDTLENHAAPRKSRSAGSGC